MLITPCWPQHLEPPLVKRAERFASELIGPQKQAPLPTPEDLGIELGDEPAPSPAHPKRGHSIRRPDDTETYGVDP